MQKRINFGGQNRTIEIWGARTEQLYNLWD
jgi:hypothetical protein